MYVMVSLAIIAISVLHVIQDRASLSLAIIGLIAGIGVGAIVSRMHKISWDKNVSQVISKLDAVGAVFLLAYVAFEIFRDRIVEYFVAGPSVVAVSFAVLAGIMIGRILGIRGKIWKVLKEEGIV
jgi:Kef-type K+ transport system membrane component KefB